MAYSALDDKSREPTAAAVAETLVGTADLWNELREQVASQFDPLAEDWVFSGKKWGWSLRLKHNKRAVLYLTPKDGSFAVGFALGEKAVAAAQVSQLRQQTLDIIDTSQRFAEGRGVRLEVRDAADADDVFELAKIKMAN